MPRIQNIGFQLKQSLRAMAAFGESKKAYKEETSRLRTEYKNRLLSQGYSKKDAHKMAQSICTYRDKIFSQSTLSAYQKAVGVFEQFCQETLGTKRLTLEEAKNHVQEFVDWNISKDLTPQTVHLRLSAICKALKLNISDYEKPIRHYADATRSVKSAQNDAYNAVHAEKALAATVSSDCAATNWLACNARISTLYPRKEQRSTPSEKAESIMSTSFPAEKKSQP